MEIDRSIDRWSVDVGVVRARAPPFLCRGVLQVGLGLHRRRSPWDGRALALADLKFGGGFDLEWSEREERPNVN